ncbi:MAG: class I SAM-dependent methyltransferase [Betaproteobacteria bacterium]|nr:class I SAM-dependent methyltransferase [Betaproteobacteria bacterium]
MSNDDNTLADWLSTRRTKWNARDYAARYERHFAELRNEPIRLLEIGIGGYDDPRSGGESLRAWKRYFPKASIFGIDIADKRALEEDRIRTFQGSQDDPAFLRNVIAEIGRPDIIIDDGSHRNDHVIKSFKLLFPHLNEKHGIYVVEDTHFSYVPNIENWRKAVPGDTPPGWALYGGSLDLYDRRTMVNYFKRLTDCLSHQEFFHPSYHPNEFDKTIVGVHFYRNQVFVLKGDNTGEGNFFQNNTLRPEWLQVMGFKSVDDFAVQFPAIDDPTVL